MVFVIIQILLIFKLTKITLCTLHHRFAWITTDSRSLFLLPRRQFDQYITTIH